MLQTHKWRRPKWIKLPRWLLEDPRWFNLSAEARATFISLLLIAGENPGSDLPPREVLFRRLQTLGNVFQAAKFDRIILELIQCGFLTKNSPELQSYRATELQKPRREKDFKNGCPIKEGETLNPLAQPHLNGGGNSKFVPRAKLKNGFDVLSQRLRLNDLSARLEAVRPKSIPRPAPADLGTELG